MVCRTGIWSVIQRALVNVFFVNGHFGMERVQDPFTGYRPLLAGERVRLVASASVRLFVCLLVERTSRKIYCFQPKVLVCVCNLSLFPQVAHWRLITLLIIMIWSYFIIGYCLPEIELFIIVAYLPPLLVGSYAPESDQSGTSPHVRYISSGLYMCLWTPYKDALWCLKFDRGRGCITFKN